MASLCYLSKLLQSTLDEWSECKLRDEMVSHSMEINIFNLLPYIIPPLSLSHFVLNLSLSYFQHILLRRGHVLCWASSIHNT